MGVFAGRPTVACPCVGIHRRTSLMCPTCLVRLALTAYEIGSKWSYNRCFVGCCFQDLSKIACNILLAFSVGAKSESKCYNHTVVLTQPQLGRIPILSGRPNVCMVVNLSIAVQVFPMRMLTSLIVDEILLPRYTNKSTNLPFSMEMA